MLGLASPLVFQDKWLQDLILSAVSSTSTFNSSLVKKNFINNDGNSKNVSRTAILRIIEFIHVSSNQDLFAIVSDSEHMMIAMFPFNPTITSFEREQNQRITDQTKGCVIRVTNADLRIYNKPSLKKLALLPQDRDFFKKFPGCSTAGVDTIVLEVKEFNIFQRDLQDLGNIVFKDLQYVYNSQKYQQCFQPRKAKRAGNDDINAMINDDYDGVVSE